MHAGRERNVLRWEAHHALLTKRLAEVDEALAALGEPKGPRERERLDTCGASMTSSRCACSSSAPRPRPRWAEQRCRVGDQTV